MSNATATGWTFTATTKHGKRVQHSASSRERARKLRAHLERLPFVMATTTPRKSA